MQIVQMVQKRDEIKALMERIKKNLAYLLAVREAGKPNEYGSISITGVEMFEALSPRFPELQEEIEAVPNLLHEMIFPACSIDVAVLSRDAIAVLSDAGIEIKMDFSESWDHDRAAYITAIFELELPPLPTQRGLKKAIPMKLSF